MYMVQILKIHTVNMLAICLVWCPENIHFKISYKKPTHTLNFSLNCHNTSSKAGAVPKICQPDENVKGTAFSGYSSLCAPVCWTLLNNNSID